MCSYIVMSFQTRNQWAAITLLVITAGGDTGMAAEPFRPLSYPLLVQYFGAILFKKQYTVEQQSGVPHRIIFITSV